MKRPAPAIKRIIRALSLAVLTTGLSHVLVNAFQGAVEDSFGVDHGFDLVLCRKRFPAAKENDAVIVWKCAVFTTEPFVHHPLWIVEPSHRFRDIKMGGHLIRCWPGGLLFI